MNKMKNINNTTPQGLGASEKEKKIKKNTI